MSWRLAESLKVLLSETNAYAPQRDKRYDGTIGNAEHAARVSRHNPNSAGVVTALDITHDPNGGMDCGALFEFLRTNPHRDLEYIIHAHQVARRSHGWKVETYTGANPHLTHLHVAVGRGSDSEATPPYDDTDSWGLARWKGEDDMDEATVRKIVREEIEQVWDEDAGKAADAHLARLGIVTKAHPGGKAASIRYLNITLSRVLKLLGK